LAINTLGVPPSGGSLEIGNRDGYRRVAPCE